MLFGTNGVRGRLDLLTPRLAFDLAASFAQWCQKGSIMLARDMRLTSPMLYCAAKSAILAAGSNLIELGLTSSPVAEFMLSKHKAKGLIVVTASHNPPEWNALKFVDSRGIAISRQRGQEIENAALSKSYSFADWDKIGKEQRIQNAAELHAAAVLAAIDVRKIRRANLKVVLDFGNGTASLSAFLFEKLGCQTILLNKELDGNFPGRPSEPSEQNISAMLETVRKESADMGIAWDGDADRVIFCDEKGNFIVGDKGFAVSAVQACKEAKGKKEKIVVTTVATSKAVEEACAEFGAKTVYTKVGAPYLAEQVVRLQGKVVSAGEEVGGIIWPSFSLAKDGIFAAAKVCEMVCERKLSSYVAQLPAYFNAKQKIAADAKYMQEALQAAKKHAEASKGKLTLLDGVRADFEDGWVIVRASGTENAMRVFAEAKSKARAEALMKEYAEVVQKALEK
ncbi:MAG: phosphoglucosamine mutase [Candidatus Micrarchaeota archaeon]|nr:phosphoglucosamine mutase [Candidatus Micrarchaeota archaeon]